MKVAECYERHAEGAPDGGSELLSRILGAECFEQIQAWFSTRPAPHLLRPYCSLSVVFRN
ncbi:hypothetical protein QA634_14245 [Methylobacterium sp. CB376]|uniref:hypothetical protein n=1 Tax=unclassified Methylobacterium TaxID=2615210 RepID=UPI0012375404|nr:MULTISPECIES: hypothetical protein [Methylobacterium]WFT82926.1 hypothetical protein QA634_14245 [Methylobacterium nodulans]